MTQENHARKKDNFFYHRNSIDDKLQKKGKKRALASDLRAYLYVEAQEKTRCSIYGRSLKWIFHVIIFG